jgi:hypothetical protein
MAEPEDDEITIDDFPDEDESVPENLDKFVQPEDGIVKVEEEQ